jgi:hypothetical protein
MQACEPLVERRCYRKAGLEYREDCTTSQQDLCTLLTVTKFVEDCNSNSEESREINNDIMSSINRNNIPNQNNNRSSDNSGGDFGPQLPGILLLDFSYTCL